MKNQKLSNRIRENIVDIMNQMRINGEFENQPNKKDALIQINMFVHIVKDN